MGDGMHSDLYPIGLIGRAGSGKSEVAKILARHFDRTAFTFATVLNECLTPLFKSLGLDPSLLTASQVIREIPRPELGGKSVRYVQQRFGTEFGREMVDRALWVRAWETRAKSIGGIVVADGVRFVEEIQAIHRLGGIVIRIHRPGDVGTSAATRAHVSETGIDALPADAEIFNDCGLEQLENRVLGTLWGFESFRDSEHARSEASCATSF